MTERVRGVIESEHNPSERIVCYGQSGSYTEKAAKVYAQRFGLEVDPSNKISVDEVLEDVCKNGGLAVLPIENTNGGAVQMTLKGLDKLSRNGGGLKIAGELDLPIEHWLLSKSPLDEVEAIVTHEQAAKQCSSNLNRLFADIGREIPIVTVDCLDSNKLLSTSRAAEMAANNQKLAAIASEEASREYGVPVVHRSFQDNPSNATRFIALSKETVAYNPELSYKTSMIVYLADRPGELYKMLKCLGKYGINMRQLNSYKPFSGSGEGDDHGFFMTIEGHSEEENTRQAFEELHVMASRLHLLGSYEKGVEVASEKDLDWKTVMVQAEERFANEKNGHDIHLLFTLKDHSGALMEALEPFAKNDVNLTLVDSWPTGKMGVFGFALSFENPQDEIRVQNLIGQMQGACQMVTKVDGADAC